MLNCYLTCAKRTKRRQLHMFLFCTPILKAYNFTFSIPPLVAGRFVTQRVGPTVGFQPGSTEEQFPPQADNLYDFHITRRLHEDGELRDLLTSLLRKGEEERKTVHLLEMPLSESKRKTSSLQFLTRRRGLKECRTGKVCR